MTREELEEKLRELIDLGSDIALSSEWGSSARDEDKECETIINEILDAFTPNN